MTEVLLSNEEKEQLIQHFKWALEGVLDGRFVIAGAYQKPINVKIEVDRD